MNSFIETLNQWGRNFLNLAWPMLWQSSLLIALVLALEFWLVRKIRASIRYALWLAVLVKLLLPPALALPTSPAWWLFHGQPAIGNASTRKYVVTYDSTAPQADFVPRMSPVHAPEPELDRAGGALLGSITVSAGLLLWLVIRWRQVTRKVRGAAVSPECAGMLEAAQQTAGSGSRVRLKIVDGQLSPAVCGLFHPVILLPRTLVEKLSAGQLRAVLLHELFHLRRKDVWVNCAQALLQIVYWWHPLLWLANARIRRVREEAVDDAVMLALRDEAEDYAPTLLEVARLAFRRPRLSLGLVGIMESRSALRQRIERLVNFRAPRKAGLTVVSLCGIFVFSAVALPMGQAPASAPDEFSAAATSAGKTLTLKVNPKVFLRNVKAQANWRLDAPTDDWTKILLYIMRSETIDCSPPHGVAFNAKTGEITTQNTPEQLEIFRQVIEQLNRPDGLYEMPPIPRRNVVIDARCFWMSSDDREKLVADLQSQRGKHEGTPHWIISPEQFDGVNRRIASLNLHPFLRPRIQTAHGIAAEFFVGNKTNGVEFDCVPFAADKGLDSGHNGIALVFRTDTVGNPTGPQQELAGTNLHKASGEVNVEDRGGFVVSAVNPDGSPTNVVMVIGVQVVRQPPEMIQTGTGRKEILAKLNQIHLDRFGPFEDLTLEQVVQNLSEVAKPQGIRFTIASGSNSSPVTIDPVTGMPAKQTELVTSDAKPVTIHLFPGMENVSLSDALDAVISGASRPVEYSIHEDGIVFSEGASDTALLFKRTFYVNPRVFLANLQKQTGPQTNIAFAVSQLLSKAGVELVPPKAIFYNDRLGMLFVRATQRDLDAVEKIIQNLADAPPQIHIKARFLEVPKGTLDGFGFTKIIGSTNPPDQFVGILTGENAKTAMKALESRAGVEELAEPEVTTASGRQTEMRATEIITVVTNLVITESLGVLSNSITPQTTQVETGPILDTIASVLPDGYKIDLKTTASLTEFLGYYTPPTKPAEHINNLGDHVPVTLPVVLPSFEIHKATANIKLWDNQTVVLGGMKARFYDGGKEVGTEPDYFRKTKAAWSQPDRENRDLLVFITVTLVDSAGNRIHSERDMPFARNAVPQQEGMR
ncbi:MAG: M56 family metallopeptidase [Verrucomicrobiota bacterium]|jgi:beta-lactamase regulating signal transducer with metallopeptidase domain